MGRMTRDTVMETGVLTIPIACELSTLSRTTINKALTANKIDGAFVVPEGREWRIPAPGLLKYLRANNVQPIKAQLVALAKKYEDSKL